MKPAQPVTSARITRAPRPPRACARCARASPGPGAGRGERRGRARRPRGASRAPRAGPEARRAGVRAPPRAARVVVAAAHHVGGVGRDVERGRGARTARRSPRARCRPCRAAAGRRGSRRARARAPARRGARRESPHERVEPRAAGRAAPRRSRPPCAAGAEQALRRGGGQAGERGALERGRERTGLAPRDRRSGAARPRPRWTVSAAPAAPRRTRRRAPARRATAAGRPALPRTRARCRTPSGSSPPASTARAAGLVADQLRLFRGKLRAGAPAAAQLLRRLGECGQARVERQPRDKRVRTGVVAERAGAGERPSTRRAAPA